MRYKYFAFVMVSFVVALLLSNTVAVKVTQIGWFYFDGATILFPLTYIFGDILTEVYGYKRSRIVIWTGFAACVFMAFIYTAIGWLPAADGWENQDAYLAILGQVPRIVLASLVAFACGEFLNSYVLAKLKIFTKGKALWTRTISSTIVGEAVDTAIFAFIAFYGVIPNNALWTMIGSLYLFKVVYEIVATPLTYFIVNRLKRAEHEDYYDRRTNFNPVAVRLGDLNEVEDLTVNPLYVEEE